MDNLPLSLILWSWGANAIKLSVRRPARRNICGRRPHGSAWRGSSASSSCLGRKGNNETTSTTWKCHRLNSTPPRFPKIENVHIGEFYFLPHGFRLSSLIPISTSPNLSSFLTSGALEAAPLGETPTSPRPPPTSTRLPYFHPPSHTENETQTTQLLGGLNPQTQKIKNDKHQAHCTKDDKTPPEPLTLGASSAAPPLRWLSCSPPPGRQSSSATWIQHGRMQKSEGHFPNLAKSRLSKQLFNNFYIL